MKCCCCGDCSCKSAVWSPYKVGILIGLLQIPAFLLIGSALGASSSYAALSGYIASIFDPSVSEGSYFAKYMTSAKYAWQGALVVGIALGAYFSARMSGKLRCGYAAVWKKVAGIDSTPQRLSMSFIGGFLILFGARLAGGCTSGHALSGVSQLAVGSIVAGVFMFAGGMLVANLMRRIK